MDISDGKVSFMIVWFSLFAAALPAQTTIVLVKQHGQIVVGADSRSRVLSSRGTGADRIYTDSVVQACKIHLFEKLYYSVSGAGDPATFREVEKNLAGAATIDAGAKQCSVAMVKYFDSLLVKKRQADTAFFSATFHSNLICKVALYGWENNAPVVVFIVFRLSGSSLRPIKTVCDYYPDVALNGDLPYVLFVLGKNNAILRLPQDERDRMLHRRNLEKPVEFLVKLEIQEFPEEVSGPVNILRLGKKGQQWLKRSPVCTDP